VRGSPATTTVAIALLVAGALAAVAILVRYERGTPDGPPPPGSPPDASAPSGGEPDAYSATVTRRFERGGATVTTETRVARIADLSRQEWTESGRRLAAILRPDRGVELLVDLDRNVYAEHALVGPDQPAAAALTGDDVEALAAEAASGATVSRERAGEETVDGRACVVYRSRVEAPDGGVTESTVWEAKELGGLAIRSESRGPDGSVATTVLSDVRLDPDPSLFEPPAGARRVDAVDVP
jgi:hypothetical protein